jgi:hypothetical protein
MTATVRPYARPVIVQESSTPGCCQLNAVKRTSNCQWEVARATAAYRASPCWRSGGGAESLLGAVGQPGYPFRAKDRRQRTQQVGHLAGGTTVTPSTCSRPQGTLAPWTAMTAKTWMSATPRTSSAWSASHRVVRRAETSSGGWWNDHQNDQALPWASGIREIWTVGINPLWVLCWQPAARYGLAES